MEKLGLNEPISVQYAKWVKNAFHGEFGISFKYKQNVTEVISGRIGNTLLLGGLGFLFIFVGSLLLGILCAWYENRLADKILCKLGTISSCIPEFWMALVLILVFAVNLRILPSSGAYSTGKEGDIGDRVLHLLMASGYRDPGASVVLCLHDPKQNSGGSTCRLCTSCEGKRTKQEKAYVQTLYPKCNACVSQHHGHCGSSCAGRNLRCGKCIFLSRNLEHCPTRVLDIMITICDAALYDVRNPGYFLQYCQSDHQ